MLLNIFNEDHLNEIKWDFHDIARFPNTVGAIDCTISDAGYLGIVRTP